MTRTRPDVRSHHFRIRDVPTRRVISLSNISGVRSCRRYAVVRFRGYYFCRRITHLFSSTVDRMFIRPVDMRGVMMTASCFVNDSALSVVAWIGRTRNEMLMLVFFILCM